MNVIDTHTHWYPRALLEAYIESDSYPGCRRDGDSYAIEILPGSWVTLPLRFIDLDVQLAEMRAAGVDTAVSSSASFGDVDLLPIGPAKELALAINEERAAAERRYPGFIGLATIPWQDGQAALDVLEDAATRLSLRGALIHSNIGGAPVDSPYLRPVYERMAELGLRLFLHPGRTLLAPYTADLGLEVMVSYMFDSSLAALRLALSGILDGLSLNVVHPHCGATLPYLASRIDGSYAKPWCLGRELPQPPSEILRSFYTDTMCQSEETLKYAINFYGPTHMLYGSDCPYFPQADSLALVRGCLSDEDARAVLTTNAARLLNLPDGS
jgi:aminocarboxymuconate-semialdehyde decarboxylase